MGNVVGIFFICAVPAAAGAAMLCQSAEHGGGTAAEVFFGLAAVTLPICYAIIHAARIRKGEA